MKTETFATILVASRLFCLTFSATRVVIASSFFPPFLIFYFIWGGGGSLVCILSLE